MNKGRLEAFSDGVIAVIITILVLELKQPQGVMLKSLEKRRDQMIDDGAQLSFDQARWNRINPDQEPIAMSFDLHEEVDWRINSRDDEKKAS